MTDLDSAWEAHLHARARLDGVWTLFSQSLSARQQATLDRLLDAEQLVTRNGALLEQMRSGS